jgi:CRP/FNR family transcriptional regulator, anaerobic regulatory protein
MPPVVGLALSQPAAGAAMQMTAKRSRSLQPGQICADCGLRPLTICGALGSDELWQLEGLAHASCWDGKANLFSQDQPAEFVYNLTAGIVCLYTLSPDGRRQVIGFALPGDFLGLALADHYGYSADAVDPITACRYSRKAFSDFVDAKPHLLRRLHEYAAHELSLAHDQMAVLGRRTALERIASFLIGLRDRWSRINGRPSVHIALPMTRLDIADFLGLTIETVSRTINRLDRDKSIVIVPGGVRLLDVARIETLAAV